MKPGAFRGMKRAPPQRRSSVTAVASKHGRSVSAEAYARRRTAFAAAERGTKLHSEIFDFLNHDDVPREPSDEFKAFARWRATRRDWKFVDGERAVVRGKIHGRYDAIFEVADKETKNKRYVIVDWKFGELGDSSRAAAALQLNLYRHMVKRGHNPPDALMIVNFKDGLYREIAVEIIPDEDVLKHF